MDQSGSIDHAHAAARTVSTPATTVGVENDLGAHAKYCRLLGMDAEDLPEA